MYRDEGMFFLKKSENKLTEHLSSTHKKQGESKESPYKTCLESIANFSREHEQLVLSDKETDFLDASKLLSEKISKTLESLDSPNLNAKSKSRYLLSEWGSYRLFKGLLELYIGSVATEKAVRKNGLSFRDLPEKGFIFTERFKERVYSTDRYPAGRYLLEVLPEFLKLLHSVLDNNNLTEKWAEGFFKEGHDWLLIYSERLTRLREEIKEDEGI